MNSPENAGYTPAKAQSILFLCGMNAIRSPMAEAIARSILPPDYFISSAGVMKGQSDPFVPTILAEHGLALPQHEPHALDELGDSYFDLIVTLSPEAHHRALELTRAQAIDVEYWPMQDPSVTTGTRDQILAQYRLVRDALETHIRQRFKASIVQENA
jgi:protein-tyrosine-phosphatase